MLLIDTTNMMISRDYKDRFRAEYYQVCIRYKSLKAMVKKLKEKELEFVPDCPLSYLEIQLATMVEYINILEMRAVAENICLDKILKEG